MTTEDSTQSTLVPQSIERRGDFVPKKPVPTLLVLFHPDMNRIGDRYFSGELLAGREFALSRTAPLFFPLEGSARRPLADPFLSRKPLLFCPTDQGDVVLQNRHMSLEVDGQAVPPTSLLDRARLEKGVVLVLAERIVLWFQNRPRPQEEPGSRYGLVGESAALLEALTRLEKSADLDIPVLIRGETGTGKELFARALHRASPRRRGPLLAVNMAAVSPNLAAAELFGSVEGAYTGACGRSGYFQKASGGTLFLDEIGETPESVQPMLLRALENREVIPVGAELPIRLDTRLVVATDASLEALIVEGRFLAPLFHRLCGFVLRLPPLRERREDIGLLTRHFLRLEATRAGCAHRLALDDPTAMPWVPPRWVAAMAAYHWPGNVRELANGIRQVVIAGRYREYLSENEWQPSESKPASSVTQKTGTAGPDQTRKPEDIDPDELREALHACRYELSATAVRLNLPRTSLYGLIRRSEGVRLASQLSPSEIRTAYEQSGGDLDAMVTKLQVSEMALRRRLLGLGLPLANKASP